MSCVSCVSCASCATNATSHSAPHSGNQNTTPDHRISDLENQFPRQLLKRELCHWPTFTRIGREAQEAKAELPLQRLQSLEPEGVGDDADGAECHAGGGDHRVEQEAVDRVKYSRGDGNCQNIIEEGPE